MPFGVSADEVVLSDDGREVRLDKDGSWTFVSEDRFATTSDGQRVRLKADGSWETVEDERNWVTLPAAAVHTNRDKITEGSVQLEITDVVIESVRSKQQKNTRLRTQMVTTMMVASDESQTIELGLSDITLRDSRGKRYETISISPSIIRVAPDSPVSVRILTDDSPKWWGVKFFTYEISPGVLGNAQSLELRRSMAEVVRRETSALSDQ